jgi:ABC-type sugar transport system substrate-binding protein
MSKLLDTGPWQRITRSVALAVAGMVALAACGATTSSQPASSKVVYFIFNGYTPPYFAPMAQGIQAVAKHYPQLQIKIISANSSASAETSAIQEAVAAGAAGIILNAVDTSVTAAAQQAMAQNIPVVTLDRDVSSPSARVAFIGDNDLKLGQQMTTACLQAAGATQLPTPYKTVVLEGTLGSTTAVDRLKGTQQVLAMDPSKVDVTLTQSADFDTGKAQSLMSEFLAKTHDIQMVVSGNDAMALGVITALTTAGITPGHQTVVCGADAQPESLTAIQTGTQAVTVTHSPYLEAFWAVEAMDNYLSHHTTPPTGQFANGVVLIPQTVVTKATVKDISAWGTPTVIPPLPYGVASQYPAS